MRRPLTQILEEPPHVLASVDADISRLILALAGPGAPYRGKSRLPEVFALKKFTYTNWRAIWEILGEASEVFVCRILSSPVCRFEPSLSGRSDLRGPHLVTSCYNVLSKDLARHGSAPSKHLQSLTGPQALGSERSPLPLALFPLPLEDRLERDHRARMARKGLGGGLGGLGVVARSEPRTCGLREPASAGCRPQVNAPAGQLLRTHLHAIAKPQKL